MKKWTAPIVALVVLVLACVFSIVSYTSARKELTDAQKQLEQVQASMDETGDSDTGLPKSLLTQMSEVTGYDDSRVLHNKSDAQAFFRSIFEWSGYEEYQENRNYAIESGIPEDSQFLTTFFPDVVRENEDGSVTSLYNDGGYELNMSYENMTNFYVTNISEDDVYSYLAVVQTSTEAKYETSDGTQKPAETAQCVLTFDMDADGNMTNLCGYLLSE